jgi:hypothetical protein
MYGSDLKNVEEMQSSFASKSFPGGQKVGEKLLASIHVERLRKANAKSIVLFIKKQTKSKYLDDVSILVQIREFQQSRFRHKSKDT